MSAEPAVGTIEQRRFHRTTVLWPASLLCRNERVDCVIFNISANGARIMVRSDIPMKTPVIISCGKFGDIAGEVVWHAPDAIGVRFFITPDEVVEMLRDKLPSITTGTVPKA